MNSAARTKVQFENADSVKRAGPLGPLPALAAMGAANERDVRQSLPSDVRQSLPSDVRQSLPSDVRQSLPSDVRQSLPGDVRQSLPGDVRQSLPGDVRQSLPRDYLGPARVVRVEPHAIEVEIRGGDRVIAEMALAYPYEPAVDDVLLVVGRGDETWVIGVVRGQGRSTLSFQGGVEVRAQGGPLTLTSDQGVHVRAPEMEMETGKLRMIAGSVTQKFTSLYQRVRESLQVHAGRTHTIVEDRSSLTAKNASIVTEQTMTINGNEIHLG